MICKFCGAELPEKAAFCPVCAKNLTEKTNISVPKPRKKKTRILCFAAVLVLAVVFMAVRLTQNQTEAPGRLLDDRQKTKEGMGMVTLDDADGHYEVMLSSNGAGLPNKSQEITVYSSRETAEMACQLIVRKDGALANAEFLEKLESLSVEITDTVGTPMTVTAPAASDAYPDAAVVSVVTAESSGQSAVLVFRGVMKNKTTFTIRQKLTVNSVPVLRYFAEEHAMHTDAELDALLKEIGETTPENAMVLLFLPAVTYEQPHTFADRSYQVLGNVDGDKATTFLAPVTFSTQTAARTDIQNAVLLGSGSGTAVTTNNSTTLYFCTVSGWEVGAETTGSGSINLQDSTFLDNGVAVRWNSENLYLFSGENARNHFAENDIALDLQRIPAMTDLIFSGCTFSGNGEDIRNPIGYPVNMSGPVAE